MSKDNTFEFLGKQRKFRYTLLSLEKFEQATGKRIADLNPAGGTNFGLRDCAAIIWAGLLPDDPSLTLDKVMDGLDLGENFIKIMSILKQAMANMGGIVKAQLSLEKMKMPRTH